MQQHRLVLGFQKFERPDEQRNIVAINRPVIAKSQLLKDHTRQNQTFDAFLNLVRKLHTGLAENRLNEAARFVVQMRVGLARHDPIKVIRNRADIFGNRPFVVV